MILYKYRNWKTKFHKNILKRNELYYASPIEVNDPFDMMIHSDFASLGEDSEREQLIKDLLSKEGIPFNSTSRQIVLRTLEEHKDTLQMEWIEAQENMFGQKFGLISLTPFWDSVLMWSHYGNNHKGFCVGLYIDELLNSIEPSSSGKVSYVNEFPKIPPLKFDAESLVSKTHIKAKIWDYEEEYRLVKFWPDNIPTVQDRKVYFPNNVFAEIVLGISIAQDERKIILKLASQKGIPTFQLKKKPFSFLIEREQTA